MVIHTVKCFSIISEAEVDIFSNSLAFSMIQRMLAMWSLVPLPFLNAAWFTYCWWEWTRSEFMWIGMIFSKQCTCWLTAAPTSAEPSPQQWPSLRKIHLTQTKIWASFMYEMFIFYRLVQVSKGTLMPIHTSLFITHYPGNWFDQRLHKQLSYFYHWLVSVLRTIDSNISLLDNSVERILHISTSCVQNQNPDFPPKPAFPPVFCISITISQTTFGVIVHSSLEYPTCLLSSNSVGSTFKICLEFAYKMWCSHTWHLCSDENYLRDLP